MRTMKIICGISIICIKECQTLQGTWDQRSRKDQYLSNFRMLVKYRN